jgi:hypothetical protein
MPDSANAVLSAGWVGVVILLPTKHFRSKKTMRWTAGILLQPILNGLHVVCRDEVGFSLSWDC